MKIKLARDEARTLQQNFFPHFIRIARYHLKCATQLSPQYFGQIIILDITNDLYKLLTKKLNGFSENFTFDLSDKEMAVAYQALMNFPINDTETWMRMIRDKITADIHKQITGGISVGL